MVLRNCFFTVDLTVKIGDYGLFYGKYRVSGSVGGVGLVIRVLAGDIVLCVYRRIIS